MTPFDKCIGQLLLSSQSRICQVSVGLISVRHCRPSRSTTKQLVRLVIFDRCAVTCFMTLFVRELRCLQPLTAYQNNEKYSLVLTREIAKHHQLWVLRRLWQALEIVNERADHCDWSASSAHAHRDATRPAHHRVYIPWPTTFRCNRRRFVVASISVWIRVVT